MDRRMLINTAHPEQCRIAIVEDGKLIELEIESQQGKKLKGNIYKARISRIEPSLQAAFLDIGTERNGFLQINDIHPAYFREGVFSGQKPSVRNVRIQEVLSPGQELVVQVVKEERELKGATLTTYLSLPGRYVVLMPGSDKGGISRKIVDGEQRSRLKSLAQELEIPVGIGLIIRTAGLNRSLSDLSRDLSLQLKLWEKILTESQSAACPTLLYKESDLATRVIRDYFTPEVREIVIDDPDTFQRVKNFVDQVMPRYKSRVKLYDQIEPLFSHYAVEDRVGDAVSDEVKLRAGGAIVIDTLEALVAIDVNSGKATEGSDIEETAFRTNLEAADEIANQLRLRDLGGLIVIDFIDMMDRRHKAQVERRLQEAVRTDKARVEIGKLSKFGLLEMSRQRLRATITSQSHSACPHCKGTGRTKATEFVALDVLRKIQSAVIVGQASSVKARLSPAPALFLLNHKKQELSALEREHSASVLIFADGRLTPDQYEFEIGPRKDGSPVEQKTAFIASPPPAARRLPKVEEEQDEDEEIDSTDEQRSEVRASADRGGRIGKFRRTRVRSRRTDEGEGGDADEKSRTSTPADHKPSDRKPSDA